MAKYTKCDYCRKKAKWNYQKVWKKYTLTNDGYFLDQTFDGCRLEEPTGEDNYHLCDDHAEMLEETGYPY